jgi:hypothetical protein
MRLRLTAENGGAHNGCAVNRSILAHLRSAGDVAPPRMRKDHPASASKAKRAPNGARLHAGAPRGRTARTRGSEDQPPYTSKSKYFFSIFL